MHKISSRNLWLVDEEVGVLGTRNLGGFTKILSQKILAQKFTFKEKQHESQKFQTTKVWSYMAFQTVIMLLCNIFIRFITHVIVNVHSLLGHGFEPLTDRLNLFNFVGELDGSSSGDKVTR